MCNETEKKIIFAGVFPCGGVIITDVPHGGFRRPAEDSLVWAVVTVYSDGTRVVTCERQIFGLDGSSVCGTPRLGKPRSYLDCEAAGCAHEILQGRGSLVLNTHSPERGPELHKSTR